MNDLLDDDGLLDLGPRRSRRANRELERWAREDGAGTAARAQSTETGVAGSQGPPQGDTVSGAPGPADQGPQGGWTPMPPDAPAPPHPPEPKAPAPATEKGPVCHVCGRSGRRNCQACGRAVCAAHHWVMFGLCRSCASEERVRRWNAASRVSSRNWLEGDP